MTEDDVTAKVGERWKTLYSRLCSASKGADSERAIFEQQTNLYTFAAAVGVKKNRKAEVKKGSLTIKWRFFDKATDRLVLTALAWWVSDKRMEVLTSPKAILQALDEYAEGGMQVLHELVFCEYMTSDGVLTIPKSHHLERELLHQVLNMSQEGPL